MSTSRKSRVAWTPFARESHFEEWLAASLTRAGCTVSRQPVYMASAAHLPSGKTTPKLDLHVKVPAEVNSERVPLELVVEIKNRDNFSALREAHRQAAAAMSGMDWRTAAKGGRQFALGQRPWRALVITPGQLRRRLWASWGYDDVSTDEQRETAPWAPELWQLYDRQLWDVGASLLNQVGPDAYAFRAHVSGQDKGVIIGGSR